MTSEEFNNNVLNSRDYVNTYLRKRFKLPNELIEDIIQDSYVKAYKFFLNNGTINSTFRTWICKVAFNTAIDYLRRNKQKDFMLHSQIIDEELAEDFIDIQRDPSPNFDDIILKQITSQNVLGKILESLKHKHPEFYSTFMVYLDVDDYKKTGALENIPIGTVKSRINKARKFVSDNISEEDLLLLN